MADPVVVAITPADTWVKVATNVINGNITIKESGPDAYYYDNRDTGGAAPTDLSTAINFDKSGTEIISNNVGIDVYVYSGGSPGTVIVDI